MEVCSSSSSSHHATAVVSSRVCRTPTAAQHDAPTDGRSCNSAPPFIPTDQETTEHKETCSERSAASTEQRCSPAKSTSGVVSSAFSGVLQTSAQPAASGAAAGNATAYFLQSMDRSKCELCGKEFRKPGELKVHMNVHYYEQSTGRRYTYNCPECQVSLRSKALLQKHIETLHRKPATTHLGDAASKNTPLLLPPSSSLEGLGTAASDSLKSSAILGIGPGAANRRGSGSNNPRPFECTDCGTAFRIHGHLAKHLRSKIHVMKLEAQNKLPMGTFHQLEASGNHCLNEVDTTDCERALRSLIKLANKLLGTDMQPPTSDAASTTAMPHKDVPAAAVTGEQQQQQQQQQQVKQSNNVLHRPIAQHPLLSPTSLDGAKSRLAGTSFDRKLSNCSTGGGGGLRPHIGPSGRTASAGAADLSKLALKPDVRTVASGTHSFDKSNLVGRQSQQQLVSPKSTLSVNNGTTTPAISKSCSLQRPVITVVASPPQQQQQPQPVQHTADTAQLQQPHLVVPGAATIALSSHVLVANNTSPSQPGANRSVQKTSGLWMPPTAMGLLQQNGKRPRSVDMGADNNLLSVSSAAAGKPQLQQGSSLDTGLDKHPLVQSVRGSSKTRSPRQGDSVDLTDRDLQQKMLLEMVRERRCALCAVEFSTPAELEIHLHADHLIMRDGQDFRCPVYNCDRVHPNRDSLRQHIIAHYINPDSRRLVSSHHHHSSALEHSLSTASNASSTVELTRETISALHRKLSSLGSSAQSTSTDILDETQPTTLGVLSTQQQRQHSWRMAVEQHNQNLLSVCSAASTSHSKPRYRAPAIKLANIPTLIEPGLAAPSSSFKSSSFEHSPASCDSSRTSSRQSAMSPPIAGKEPKDRPVLKRRSTEEHSNSSTNSTGSQPKHSSISNTNTADTSGSGGAPSTSATATANNVNPLLAAYWYNVAAMAANGQTMSSTPGVPHQPNPLTSCPICAKQLSSPQSLQDHLLTHVSDRPHVCEQCDAGFTTADALNQHKRTHSIQSPVPL